MSISSGSESETSSMRALRDIVGVPFGGGGGVGDGL